MRLRPAAALLALAVLLLSACTSRVAGVGTPRVFPPIPSPSGWCEAYVAEWFPGEWQVNLRFDGGRYGAGAVSASANDPRFKLRWVDQTTLEVEHDKNVQITRNASGEVLQGGGPDRRVRVVLKPI